MMSNLEPWQYDESTGELDEETAALLGQVAQQTEQPLLKAMLEVFLGRDLELQGEDPTTAYTTLQATLEQWLEAEPNRVEALLLSAGLATHQQRWSDAATWLERTARQPLPADQRRRLDSAAVALALKGQVVALDEPEQASLVAVARSAALRLRRHALNGDQRLELLQALEVLDLTEEAGQMQSRLAQSSGGAAGLGRVARSGRTTSPDRIFELLQNDKKDAAYRLLSQDLQALARTRLAGKFALVDDDDYELRQFQRMVNQLQVSSELLQHVMTEMSDRVDMLGFVQELFGDREQAVEYYRQFVEANPGRDAVQLRGLLLQLSSPNFELAEGLAMLDTLDSKSLPTFGLQILSKLPTLPLTFEQRLQVVEYLLNRAEPEAEQDPNSVAWLTAAWPVLTAATSLDPEVSEESEPFGGRDQNRQSSSTQDLGAAMESMAARLSPLYVPTSDVELNEDELGNEKLRAVYQRIQQAKITRTAMQERVCQLLLTAPQTASEAFSHWLAVREAQRQVDSAAAVEQATSVLRLVATASASGRGSSNAGVSAQQRAMRQMMQQMQRGGMPSPYGQNEESTWRTVPLRTPAQFLTRQLGESPSAENAALIAELSEGLRAQRKVELANELQRRYELQAATAEDFGGVVSRLMSEGKQRRNNTAENPNQLIMEVYTERELKVDLLPSLLTQIRADREENQWNRLTSNQELLAGYLTRHVEIQGASAIAPSIRELSLAWLGDEATQTRLIERFGGKENLPAGRGEAAPYATYVTFLTSLANGSPRLAFAGLTELERLQATQQVSLEYVGYAVSQAIGEERDAAVILAIFDSSPFFNGLETFQPYPLSNGNGESVYGTLLNRLRYSEFRTRRSVVRKLKEREPTFGLRVFLESFEKTGRWEKLSVKEVHEALKPELEQLAALTDERLKVVVDFIKEVTEGSDNSTNQGDPEVLAVLSRGVEILSPLQRLMDAKSIANLGIQPYPYAIQEYASGVLLPLLKEHPDDFLAGMKHLLKLAAPVYRRQGDNVSELVSRLLTGAVSLDPPRGLAVSLRYASETNSEGFDLFEFLEDSLVRDLSRALQVALIAVHSERNSDQLQVFSQDLSQALEDADVSVLHFPFTRLLDSLSLSADNRTAIAKWAQQAQQDDKLAAIAQQWWLATQLANLAVVDSSTPNVDQASVRQILLEQVRDPNRAVPFRFVSALSLLSWKLLGDQPDDFALCLDVISENLSRSKQVTTAPQWLMTVLTRLEAIPDDAELQAVGGKFMTLWERYAGQATRGYFGRPALLPSIRLYHRLQKPSGVQAVVRGLGELEPGPDVIGELTRLGYANLAWSQLNRRWGRIETPELDLAAAPRPIADANEASRMVWFDATLEAKLPDLLALANHPGTKYLTELYLSQLLDPPATQSQPSVARRQRLERLAASFGEQTFANTDEQKLAVAMLVQLESPPDAVLTGLRTLVDKLSPTDIWSRRLEEVSSRRNRDLLTQQIVVELRAGQRESLAKLLAQVDAMPADDWETRQALSQLLERLSANLMRGLAGLDAETLVAVAPDLLKLEAKDEFNRSSRLRILLQIWFHVQGRSPEFTGLLAAVDGGSGAAARFLGGARTSSTGPNIDEVWPLVKRMKADAGETPLEERVKLVKGIWELTKTGATVGSGHFREGVKESCDSCRVARMGLDAIEDAGLLSNEELITIGPELARIDAVGGEIWRQIGQRQMAAEQWEAAASSLKRAVSATGRTMAQARANRQLEYAWALHQAGDNEEAKKLVPKVTAELLMGDNPQRLEQLKKLIE
jgi:tetratricopeptide (TPR) repeat protein